MRGNKEEVNMFKCIKKLILEKYDDNGRLLEDEKFEVTKGSEWVKDEDGYREIDGEIRLENDDAEWIEISRKTFKEHFIEVK